METCPKTPTLLELKQNDGTKPVNFFMSDSVRSRTEGCKNHAHVKTEKIQK